MSDSNSNPATHPVVDQPNERHIIRPESNAHCFHVPPRTEGAPYPPYSFDEAFCGRLLKEASPPKELDWLTEELAGYVMAADEYLSSVCAVAGVLYRQIEDVGGSRIVLDLARAVCLAASEAQYNVEMTGEYLRLAIVDALGERSAA